MKTYMCSDGVEVLHCLKHGLLPAKENMEMVEVISGIWIECCSHCLEFISTPLQS